MNRSQAATVKNPPRLSAVFPRRHVPWLALALGSVISLLVFWSIRFSESASLLREFARRASNVALRAEEYLLRNVEPLYSLRNLFDYSGEVTREEFNGAARDLISRSISMQALEWVPRVPSADRARIEAQVRAEGFPDFQFTERTSPTVLRRAADRPEHFPVLYVEPYAANRFALGFDLVSGVSWPDLQSLAATGKLGASGRLPLLDNENTGSASAYIVQLPVYARPLVADAAPAPGAIVRGYILGVFRLRDLLGSMFTRTRAPGVDVLFLDRSARPDRQFLHYHNATPGPAGEKIPTIEEFSSGLHVALPLDHAGRRWELWVRPDAAWLAAQPFSRSWLALTLGLTLSASLALLLRSQQRRTALVERLVDERTAELTESQRQLDSLMAALPGVAFRLQIDGDRRVLYASAGVMEFTGYPAGDYLSGRRHFRDHVHPDDLPALRRATGEALANRQAFEVTYRFHTKAGVEKWVLSRGRAFYAADGTAQFIEGLAIDITPQKTAESGRLALERKLLDTQKLESLGLLAGGIAHDFNNLLTVILGHANLARLGLPRDAVDTATSLLAIETASTRAAELCSQMLAYAGKGRFVVQPADLNHLLGELGVLLKVSVGQHASLTLDLASALPPVLADATQLRQVVMNLVINATEAIGNGGGDIRLVTAVRPLDAATLATAAVGTDRPPGDYVYLEVHDTGPGMSPAVLAKIFDPFFSTKFTGRGLGLAAVLGIVRSHDGVLLVESTVGRGTAFRLFLPPTAAAAVPAPAGSSGTPWHRPSRVLVIDDDESVRAIAAAMLRSFGYAPEPKADGYSGLAAFRAAPAAFELVVLDLLMPGLSGEETLVELRRTRPGVPVLIISGYNEGGILARHAGGGPLAYLGKPFTRGELQAAVRALVE